MKSRIRLDASGIDYVDVVTHSLTQTEHDRFVEKIYDVIGGLVMEDINEFGE